MSPFIRRLRSNFRIKEKDIFALESRKAQEPNKGIPELLIEMKLMDEATLMHHLKDAYGIDTVELDVEKVDMSVLTLVPYETVRRYGIVPIGVEDRTLILATCDPFNLSLLDDLRSVLEMRIKPVYAPRKEIESCVEKLYKFEEVVRSSFAQIVSYDNSRNVEDDGSEEGLFNIGEISEEDSPIVKLANLIFGSAIWRRASDIHIEPQQDAVRVRIRVDGYLRPLLNVPLRMKAALAARVKIISNLNIAECRKPQDGRTAVIIDGRKVDVRVSVTPTFYGEKIVMRLLDVAQARIYMDHIGLEGKNKRMFLETISRPQGMILVTGPTGSGKTSTLYASMNHLKQGNCRNIVTVEDPIEYLIDGVTQVQLSAAKSLTFAKALRSILRQDPDIVFIGEIRDRETADIAMRSALTGHLVFSTLHTVNSIASVTRLMDIGIEPFLISSSLLMVVAQRLVRRICPDCRERYEPDPSLREKFSMYLEPMNVTKFYRGKGCRRCLDTGYYGRTAVFEILRINDRIRRLITKRAMEEELFRAAKMDGMRSLAESGVEKVAQGITTLEEIHAVMELMEVEKKFQSQNTFVYERLLDRQALNLLTQCITQ